MPVKEYYYLNSEVCPLTNKVVITDNKELAKNIHKYVMVTCLYIDIESALKKNDVFSVIYDIISVFENNCDEYYLAVEEKNVLNFLSFLCLEVKILDMKKEIITTQQQSTQQKKRGRPPKNKNADNTLF